MPRPKTPIVLPEPRWLSTGHTDPPVATIMASLASHVASAEVSNLVPTGKRSSILWMIFGAPPGAPGSLQVITVESPVETLGSADKNAIWNVARNSELAPAS
jgi:hypothetical protein